MFDEVLIADDDPVSRRLLQVGLGNAGYKVSAVSDGAQALQILNQSECPRLVVLDWLMPAMDGVQVCREVRKTAREPYRYIILLTAKGHQTEIIEGLEAGADDYVTKPYDLQELKARLRAGKRILELQQQLLTAREQLRVQATHDSLTGLLNRMAILEALDRETTRCRREKRPVGVIMADLDRFKQINDTYGHQAGDAVLRETARRMSAAVRSYDLVGRYGGEEFLVVVPGSELAQAADLAERLRHGVSAQPITVEEGTAVPVTVSLGVAVSAEALGRPEALLGLADEALYAAKAGGRNRVEVAAGQEAGSQPAEVPQAAS